MDSPRQPATLCNVARQLLREEDGQDVVEYGLLVATIGLLVLGSTTSFGHQIQEWFQTIADRVTTT